MTDTERDELLIRLDERTKKIKDDLRTIITLFTATESPVSSSA